jgi:hypothetical protein
VSIAELPNRGGNSNYSAPEFERTPPQDLIAEQSVLGGMLLSKDAIADVVEILRERDFYRPAHELIYDVIIDLYGRGEPADAVTVSAELAKRGDIVTIDYVGRFAMNGQKFDDSSLNPEPFEFELGKPDQILKGLEKAIYKLQVGGKAEVFFSSRFGYGAQGSTTGIVSKYKSLTFAVHLKKINKKQNELN